MDPTLTLLLPQRPGFEADLQHSREDIQNIIVAWGELRVSLEKALGPEIMGGEGDVKAMADGQPLPPEFPSTEHTPTADASKVENVGTSMTAEAGAEVSQENTPIVTMPRATDISPETATLDAIEVILIFHRLQQSLPRGSLKRAKQIMMIRLLLTTSPPLRATRTTRLTLLFFPCF